MAAPLLALSLVAACSESGSGEAPYCRLVVGRTTLSEAAALLGPPALQIHQTQEPASNLVYALPVPEGGGAGMSGGKCQTTRLLFDEAGVLSAVTIKANGGCSLLGPEVVPACLAGPASSPATPPPAFATARADEPLCQLTLGMTSAAEVEGLFGKDHFHTGRRCLGGHYAAFFQYISADPAAPRQTQSTTFDFDADDTLVRVTRLRELSTDITPLPRCLRASAPPGFDPEQELVCGEDAGVPPEDAGAPADASEDL